MTATAPLFRDDAYRQRCEATVTEAGAGVVVLDRTVFYPTGGGQPGDSGRMLTATGEVRVADTRHGSGGRILHRLAEGAVAPAEGDRVELILDWERRYAHMRMHTCLHLLGAVLRYGVTGGNISARRSRLDFDMEEPVDRGAVSAELNAMISADHEVRAYWISESDLDARPELVRTLSVRPPRGVGRIRLLEIPGLDLQPCGGTHVRRTGEIGAVEIPKVEKKGRRNRRVYVSFAEASLSQR
jgi:misacylated tRNA(Ala) deacylase